MQGSKSIIGKRAFCNDQHVVHHCSTKRAVHVRSFSRPIPPAVKAKASVNWPGSSSNPILPGPGSPFSPPKSPPPASDGIIYPWSRGYQLWSALTTAAAALSGILIPLEVALGVGR